jgi:hypothetical protein
MTWADTPLTQTYLQNNKVHVSEDMSDSSDY